MFKLLKYEMAGRLKLMVAVTLGIVLLNSFITFKFRLDENQLHSMDLAMGLTFLVGFTAAIIAYFNGILVFKRDLYSETGYLVYTLPKKAYYIINTKLIAAMLEIGLYGIVAGGFFLKRMYDIDGSGMQYGLKALLQHPLESIESFIMLVLGIAFAFLLAYFSLALSRATFGNRRYGEFLAIVIFFVISYLLGRISYGIIVTLNVRQWAEHLNTQTFIVCSILINLLFCIGLTMGTHFMIEKKVDL